MGGDLLGVICDDFVSIHPPGLSIYDIMCSITLDLNLDSFFDVYELSLRHVGPVRSSSCTVAH